ncbi:uncharacterized protein LOC106011861 [Aplysia californica]|uniref:Uncharacterized protein LOC106011861 n=1 Tax=Aplysia californica TaxID=6500 RepID=A0ABM1A0M4_APLCA|nr:uncharacterized protein LOC106011861 [Aplysia californica]
MPSRDPRLYVKAVPLPIDSQKGLKLQARSAQVYNPTSPTRDEVRQWNYNRRLQQRTDQGFYAHNFRPYKGLGDPFYLEEKKLILHALGQWDETVEWETSSSSEDEDDGEATFAIAPQSTMVSCLHLNLLGYFAT